MLAWEDDIWHTRFVEHGWDSLAVYAAIFPSIFLDMRRANAARQDLRRCVYKFEPS